jgi:glutaredoxin
MAIEIYSKKDCAYCDKAKQLLRVHGKDYLEYKLDEDFSREILLSKFPEAKTFPVIVIDGMNVGGYDQLFRYITEETNDSRKLLNESGA